MRVGTGSDAADLHRLMEALRPSGQPRIDVDRLGLAEAEAEQLLATLSGDLCAARCASAAVKAIKARQAATEEHC
jgi:hypothetical protein